MRHQSATNRIECNQQNVNKNSIAYIKCATIAGDQRDVILSDSFHPKDHRDHSTRGWRLVVHEKDTAPILKRKIDIMPSTSTSIAISSVQTKKLQKPYTSCISNALIPNPNHLINKDSCLKYCLMAEVERKGNCVPADLVLNRVKLSRNYCLWFNITNAMQIFETYHCEQKVRQQGWHNKKTCAFNCEWRCQETKYLLQTSISMFPPREAVAWFYTNYLHQNPDRDALLAWKYFVHNIKEENKTAEDYVLNPETKKTGKSVVPDHMAEWIYKSFSRVNVYFDSLDVTVRKQQPSYSLEQLWADLGGIVGVWVGLSIFEILKFVFKSNIPTLEKGDPSKTGFCLISSYDCLPPMGFVLI